MSYFVSREFLRVVVLAGIVGVHVTWYRLITSIVPDPYLDEVFHAPQAQAYWAGRWSKWDPKLTTPPGLYAFSHAVNTVRAWFIPGFEQTTEELRFINVSLLYLLLVSLYIWTAVSRQSVSHDSVLQREFSVICFPLFFFFSGLYYTDLFSAWTVVLAYTFWTASIQANGVMKALYQSLHLLAGAVSLATRQTNIFWVAVFLGGLQVVDSVKKQLGAKKIHDPPVSDAYFEDFPITSISIAQHAFAIIPQLLLDLWPQIALLISFAAFVAWNGGVVLGDKDNHIATLHFPQMLYIWPLIVFFSWPVLLPFLADLLSASTTASQLKSRLPRLATVTSFLVLLIAIVNANTLIHPFTLADNRHYTFYIFRILTRHYLVRYAAVPVYLACAWLVISALGRSTKSATSSSGPNDVVRVSFVLVWLISTTLSLITAPLVEPRYFIVPWLLWRLHMLDPVSPEMDVSGSAPATEGAKPNGSNREVSRSGSTNIVSRVLQSTASWSTWIELAWYMLINVATGYMFLYRGFTWPQEEGRVQRFMW